MGLFDTLTNVGNVLENTGDRILARTDPSYMQALAGGGNPANVREYQYFSQLSPEEQKRYLAVKRAQQVVDLGGSQQVLNPLGGVQETYDKTLPPQFTPQNVMDRAAAGAQGTAQGEAQGAIEKKSMNAPDILNLIAEARQILPGATSGGAATAAKNVSQFFGKSTDSSKVDRQLKIIGSALTNYVPRFEGPQSDYDVQTYKDAAGDVSNTTLPYEDRLAALDTIEALQAKYATPGYNPQGGIPKMTRDQFNQTYSQAPAMPPSLDATALPETQPQVEERKVINGTSYVRMGGQWYQE